MTRQEKIVYFLNRHPGYQRYCTARLCACMGCINSVEGPLWRRENPSEPDVTKREFDDAMKLVTKRDDQQPINFSFKGYPTTLEGTWTRIENALKHNHYIIQSLDLLLYAIKEEDQKHQRGEEPDFQRLKEMILAMLSAIEKK